MDVMDLGRWRSSPTPPAPSSAIWQPGTFAGAGLVNEPGALAWNELNTRDVEACQGLLRRRLRLGLRRSEMGETSTYTTITLGGNPVGGILDMVERGVPEEIPTHWLAYFAVEDADATVAQANERGGSLMMGPIDIPVGRFAILTDPHGAAFAVIALSENAPSESA